MNGMSRRRAVVAGDWLCELTASRGMFSSQFTVALTVSFIIPRGLRLGGLCKQIWHNLHINVRIQLEETRQKSEAKPFSWHLLCYDLTSQHPVLFCWERRQCPAPTDSVTGPLMLRPETSAPTHAGSLFTGLTHPWSSQHSHIPDHVSNVMKWK